ncbi:MAG: cold-shock protein [Actinobacteria bacterium]|nr:cold-shock protein [Actinomycetota bacterium]
MEGKMLFFNEEKDYGFIRTAEGERIAVNRAGFLPGEAPVGRCAGLPVRLTPVETDAGRVATDVSVLVEKEVGRARRRSSR